eukprot:jgi/Galph1/1644/GphlegSOOS_G324.1
MSSVPTVFLEEYPQFLEYATICPSLLRNGEDLSFGCKSFVAQLDDILTLVGIISSPHKVNIVNAASGNVLFEIQMLEEELTRVLESHISLTSGGSFCSLLFSPIEEYVPGRFIIGLWLLYSNGLEYTAVFFIQFCVKVFQAFVLLSSLLKYSLDRNTGVERRDKFRTEGNNRFECFLISCVMKLTLFICTIELLALPKDCSPFSIDSLSCSALGGNLSFLSDSLQFVWNIFEIDIGGPVALVESGSHDLSESDWTCLLISNFSIKCLQVEFGTKSISSHLLKSIDQELSCITAATRVSVYQSNIETSISNLEPFDAYPQFVFGTIGGELHLVFELSTTEESRILDVSEAVVSLGVSSNWLICGTCKGKIFIYNRKLTDSKASFDILPSRTCSSVRLSTSTTIRHIQTIADDMFIILCDTDTLLLSVDKSTEGMNPNATLTEIRYRLINLIGHSRFYCVQSTYGFVSFQSMTTHVFLIAEDGSYFTFSDTNLKQLMNLTRNKEVADNMDLGNADNSNDNPPYQHSFFERLEKTYMLQKKYQEIYSSLKTQLSKVSSLLHFLNLLEDCGKQQTAEDHHCLFTRIRQVKKIQSEGDMRVSLEEHRVPCYLISVELIYESKQVALLTPFSLIIQWKSLSNSENEVVSQHTSYYDWLPCDSRKMIDLPLYKTSYMGLQFRVFMAVHLEDIARVIGKRSYPSVLLIELPCERNVLDTLDFCVVLNTESRLMHSTDLFISKNDKERKSTCRLNNPKRLPLKTLVPVEWSVSEKCWRASVNAPSGDTVNLIQRQEVIVIQASPFLLPFLHYSLMRRLKAVEQPMKQVGKLETKQDDNEEEQWRNKNKVVQQSLENAQQQLHESERKLEELKKWRNENNEPGWNVVANVDNNMEQMLNNILEAYQLWRGCCFLIKPSRYS